MEEFQLSKFTKEGAELLAGVTAEFKRLNLDTSNLPKVFPDDSGAIKLVFVGQYSAGKSSIIKMLTGEDVAIGAKITTQVASPYAWNGLEIIDTPGIHTELRPDHDELTYNQINHAALLIFVITNEGFSQRMGDHFRELAIEQKRADNMVLVVNKMGRTARGNVPEQQKVIYEDLKKVTEPYDPKNLYLSFLDTEAYFDSLEENDDEELKAELLEESGHDAFVENLNKFVAEKGVLQKINLPLNTIAAEIRKAMESSLSEENKDISAFIGTFEKRKKILEDGKEICLDEVKDIANQCRNEISRQGRRVADDVLSQKSQEDAKAKYKDAQKQVKEIAKKYSLEISECIKKFLTKTKENIRNYEQSAYVQGVNMNIVNLMQNESSGTTGAAGLAGGAGAMAAGALALEHGAQIAAQYATPLTQVVTSSFGSMLGNAAKVGTTAFLAEDAGIFSSLIGNEVGNLVKGLPIFQETIVAEATTANKIASIFTGNGSKFLGAGLAVAGVFFSIWSLNKQNKEQQEAERKRSQMRYNIIEDFNVIGEDVSKRMIDGVKKWFVENVEPLVAKFDDEIKAIQDSQTQSKVKSEKLDEMLKRTENLIGAIQAS